MRNIEVGISTERVSSPVYWARYVPEKNEDWFLTRDEKGNVIQQLRPQPETRSADTEEEAIRLLMTWLDAAKKNARYKVRYVNKKGKAVWKKTCGADKEDVVEFFTKKKWVQKVLGVK